MKPLKAARRRRRPDYPALKPGQEVVLERPECGNMHCNPIRRGHRRRMRHGNFLFSRASLPVHQPRRSRHHPA